MDRNILSVVHLSRSHTFSGGASVFGGIERAVLSLSDSLNQSSVHSKVIHLERAVYSEENWDETLKTHLKDINKCQFDIIHAHDWYGGRVVKSLFDKGFRKIVFSSHLPIRRGFTYRDTDAAWHTKLQSEAQLIDMAKKVIVPSKFTADFLMQEYGVSSSKIEVISHGVDLSVFNNRDASTLLERDPRILFVGRIEHQKGVEILIRAMAHVVERLPKARLELIGDGSRRKSSEALVIQLKLTENVCFSGEKDTTALRRAYCKASLMVLPSLFEPFGLVGLEALACGCPVLSVKPTGADYLKESDFTHQISPKRLAGEILKRLPNGVDLKDHRPSQNYDLSGWTWEKSAEKTRRIYEAVENGY